MVKLQLNCIQGKKWPKYNSSPMGWKLNKKELPTATIVETNVYYKGGRYTTEGHREIL